MDDVLLNKIAIIEKCINRVKEEYEGHESDFETNYTKQDSIILNLQRICEATIDIGARLIRMKHLGIPQSTRDIFFVLEKSETLPKNICQKLQSMVGFRNIAVHDYKALNLVIVKSILDNRLQDFSEFTKYLFEAF